MEGELTKTLNIPLNKLNDLPQVAEQIIAFADGLSIWLFEGEMGAGKTTLIKAICEQLEVLDQTSSPTFSLVNEYLTAQDDTVYHFDFYRIESEKEAVDMGVFEYFDSGSLCLIEWPSKISGLLPDHYLSIEIHITGNESREILLNRHE
jgi:tRNA threonylcarbamoyladenosine biosynthesis protein TsaE